MFSSRSSDPAERAKALLLHYLSNAANGKDPRTDPDCMSEVGSIIDDAVEAAARRAQHDAQTWARTELAELEARLNASIAAIGSHPDLI